MKNIFPIVLPVLVLLAVVSFGVSSNSEIWNGGRKLACTMDAKICPDGSAVGRTGPKCEFAKCPGETFSDVKNGTYIIENTPVTLVNGVAEVLATPGSASKIETRYFGNEAGGDLNGDGTPDIAFLLTQEGGGSGTFFYLVAALKTASGYLATSALFLGDRIAPQTMEIRNGVMVVNYADRSLGEPVGGSPAQDITRRFRVYDH